MKAGYVLSGRYKIKKSLGEGGMANVYLAFDLILKREVAVKLMRLDLRDNPAAIRRFKREAISLTELAHPNIVSIYDLGEDNGMQYLIMEYVEGMDLKEYIAQNFPFAYSRVIGIMEQILSAVSEAHAHDIIHRDLKPQNILINEQGQVKITDFGIALATSEYSLTQTNTLMGSVHYLSPEQARGSLVTKQSDIYSLGIILFEMLTGRVPYQGETAVSIALKHFQNEMPSVRAFDHSIPQPLENVVLRATAKNLRERYQTVAEMAADLRTTLSATRATEPKWHPFETLDDETKVLEPLKIATKVQKKKPTVPEKKPETKTKKWSTKKKWLFWGGICFILLLVVFAALSFALSPHNVSIPDLRGMTKAEAKGVLSDRNLKVGKVSYQNNDKYYQGQVISSTPEEATNVRENSQVSLVLSKGPEKFKFGDYTGQSYATVKKKLEAKGVTVLKQNEYSNTVAKGEILDQTLSKNKKVVWDQTTVTFTVSSGAGQSYLRDLTGYTEKSVRDYANELGLVLKVKKESSSDSTAGLVIAQDPAVGSPVQSGDVLQVTLAANTTSSSSSSSASSSSQEKTFAVNVTLPYANNASSTSTGAQQSTTNKIEIYLQDKNHSFSSVYQTLTIARDTEISLPFTLDGSATGKYKVVRDGQVVAEKDNIKDSGN
ncbi:Stk1 family PASTA domain-containing Ser/Thr kinase [Liquorilactobacillus satsumensis]|uniref:Stk1 family PASTA domain-containing Ser/Thr kinase n=1 Tax=Liquorilactobacillus satsumensis TaxID=259059 RepID=UPI0021C47765|nr:Stk1 family PASTA domain-containing Ser/Thr kinase [Liquorilactobacillus satsumensis]MCP9311835.1 Stk1 family PASTA domain-containing Ser/Thr kinase [Liquorilactobacillus satsumensis]MCP9358968.1 Stk1 family PASTA domain-containing Ser/Thr kinase [Liquorilactobacillus satsumensis]